MWSLFFKRAGAPADRVLSADAAKVRCATVTCLRHDGSVRSSGTARGILYCIKAPWHLCLLRFLPGTEILK
jgi:hypothetical protein